MKILLAPDSFKGSLSTFEVCKAMEVGIRRVISDAEIVSVPMADGGEGTVKALIAATRGRLVSKVVTDPLGQKVVAEFGILGDGKTAVIEMAQASGLPLVPLEKRNPLITTTYGTGELMIAALEEGCNKLLIGIGGSATNDGGAGMAQALGFRLLDQKGHQIFPGGSALKGLYRIETSGKDPRLQNVEVIVACDVNNPLTGQHGATAVYGPQKGATAEMVSELDQALEHFANLINRDLGIAIGDLPGAGAAGGLGAGLLAFLNATLRPGVEIVMDILQLGKMMVGSDLVVTGEGRIDGQTVNGKAPIGVAKTAKSMGIPVLAVAGGLGPGAELVYDHGINGLTSIIDQPMSLETAIGKAESLVAAATERIFRVYLTGYRGFCKKVEVIP